MASTILIQRHSRSHLHHPILLGLLSFTIPSLAQFNDIPICADSCVSILPAACNYGLDLACLCKDTTFLQSATCCVESSCSSADQETAFENFSSECLTVGVTVPQQPGCSGQSSVGGSSAAASSAAPSSAAISSAAASSATASSAAASSAAPSRAAPSSAAASSAAPSSAATSSEAASSGAAAASSFDNAGFAQATTSATDGGIYYPTPTYSLDIFPTYSVPSITTDPIFYPTSDSSSGGGSSSGDSEPHSYSASTYNQGLSTGGKAGIGVGGGAFGAIIGALALLYRRHRQRQRRRRALHATPAMGFDVGPGGGEEAKVEGVVSAVPVGAGAVAGVYGYGAPAPQQPTQFQQVSPVSSPPPQMQYAPSSTGPSEIGFSEVSSQGPIGPQNLNYGAPQTGYCEVHSQTPD